MRTIKKSLLYTLGRIRKVAGLSEEAIVGALTIQKWRIKLNFEKDTVEVDPGVARLQLI